MREKPEKAHMGDVMELNGELGRMVRRI